MPRLETRRGKKTNFPLKLLEEMQHCWSILDFWSQELSENIFVLFEPLSLWLPLPDLTRLSPLSPQALCPLLTLPLAPDGEVREKKKKQKPAAECTIADFEQITLAIQKRGLQEKQEDWCPWRVPCSAYERSNQGAHWTTQTADYIDGCHSKGLMFHSAI